jgi:hypothetical protein
MGTSPQLSGTQASFFTIHLFADEHNKAPVVEVIYKSLHSFTPVQTLSVVYEQSSVGNEYVLQLEILAAKIPEQVVIATHAFVVELY